MAACNFFLHTTQEFIVFKHTELIIIVLVFITSQLSFHLEIHNSQIFWAHIVAVAGVVTSSTM